MKYVQCDCAARRDQASPSSAEAVKPLKECWEYTSDGRISMSQASLEWECCGTSVGRCDGCNNLINLPRSGQIENSMICKHCGFPVVTNSDLRRSLKLEPLHHFSFERAVETQIDLVGKARYDAFKRDVIAQLESQIGASKAAPKPLLGSPKKRRRRSGSKSQEGTANNKDDDLVTGELAEKYISFKWQMICLSKSREGARVARSDGSAGAVTKEELHVLDTLYHSQRLLPHSSEQTKAAAGIHQICLLAIKFLQDYTSMKSLKESVLTNREVLACMQDDLKFLENRLPKHEELPESGDLLAMANSLSGKASAQFAVKIEQYRHLPEEIGNALQKIVYIVNRGRSSEAMDTFCHSLAFGILQRLYQMVYQCCCDFQSLPSNMSSQT